MHRTTTTFCLAIVGTFVGTLWTDITVGQIDGIPPVRPGSIHGVKWSDENGDGRRSSTEPGLPGVTIYLDLNFNGVLDDRDLKTISMRDDPATNFNEAGLYWFNEVKPDGYVVREVVPDGFEQTFPPEGAHKIRVESGQTVEGINFGNRKIEPASIHGQKWSDKNGNAEREADEPGLAGVTIYSDRNSNGRLDPGEPSTRTMRDDPNTRFDESGRYWLDVRPGRHVVREIVPDGFVQTFPPGPVPVPVDPAGAFATVEPSIISLVLAAGDMTVRDVSITIHPLCIRPFEIDVVASDAASEMVKNLTGIVVNGCGGDVSKFEIQFTGDGLPRSFDLLFVDSQFGGVLASIPVRINRPNGGGAHVVVLESGDVVDGVDFGNRPIKPGSIHGHKWSDNNGNAERDADEPGLPGVTVFSDRNNNGRLDPGEPSVVTMRDDPNTDFDESGLYWLELRAGRHLIREVVPDGFVQTFPPAFLPAPEDGLDQFASVQPKMIHVELAAGEMATREVSLTVLPFCFEALTLDVVAPGAPAGVFQNLTGVQVNGCGGSTSKFQIKLTGDGGSHSFNLQFVDVNFGGVMGTIPVHINRPDAGGAHVVVLESGDVVEGLDFGNRPIKPGSIHGRKWSDNNGNAERDLNEPGLPGVTVYLDRNNNGRPEDGEPSAITMKDDPDTDFDESGLYWLEVRPGRHVIREVVPDGFVQTFPRGPIAVPEDDGIDAFAQVEPSVIQLTLAAGEVSVREVALTIHPLCIRPFKIDVVAVPDAAAQLVENLTGIVVNGCGGDTSKFEIQFIGDGLSHSFELQFVDAEFGDVLGVIPVRINRAHPGGAHIVVVGSGQTVEGIDFGNRPIRPGNIHGIKWSDRNGNGRRDPDEPGLPGVIVYLDLNFNGRLDDGEPHAITMEENPFTDFDEGGLYWLEVKPGRYIVREVVPDGFRQTFPGAGAHRVVVGSGETVEGIDFGNRHIDRPNQVPGDCNQNGECEFSDAICLLRFLFSRDRRLRLPCGDGTIEHPSNVLLLDFTGDGSIDLGDVIAKLYFILLRDRLDHVLGDRCVFIPDCGETCGVPVD